MKSASAKRTFAMKRGAVSLSDARAAARIAKADRPTTTDARGLAPVGSPEWALYLGHFGSAASKRGSRKSAVRKSTAKRSSAAKKKSSSPKKR